MFLDYPDDLITKKMSVKCDWIHSNESIVCLINDSSNLYNSNFINFFPSFLNPIHNNISSIFFSTLFQTGSNGK